MAVPDFYSTEQRRSSPPDNRGDIAYGYVGVNSGDQAVPEPGVYKHYKGDLYGFGGLIAVHSETGEKLVIYSRDNKTFARPLGLWNEEIRPGVKRFTRYVG